MFAPPIHRRQILTLLTAVALVPATALAAQPVVEIIAFAHPPVQSSLKPLRDWLATQGSKVRVVEFVNFPQGLGTPAGAKGGWSAADVQAALAKVL